MFNCNIIILFFYFYYIFYCFLQIVKRKDENNLLNYLYLNNKFMKIENVISSINSMRVLSNIPLLI